MLLQCFKLNLNKHIRHNSKVIYKLQTNIFVLNLQGVKNNGTAHCAKRIVVKTVIKILFFGIPVDNFIQKHMQFFEMKSIKKCCGELRIVAILLRSF